MPPQSLASNLNVDANIFSPMSRVRLESWKMRNEEAAASETMDIDTSKIVMKAGYNQSNEGNMLKMKETEVNTYQDTHYYKASYESDIESSKPRQHQGGRRRRSSGFVEYCRFCRNNGEDEAFYMSHVTKDSGGAVKCPILRNYTCPR